jgi:hypothetical protein
MHKLILILSDVLPVLAQIVGPNQGRRQHRSISEGIFSCRCLHGLRRMALCGMFLFLFYSIISLILSLLRVIDIDHRTTHLRIATRSGNILHNNLLSTIMGYNREQTPNVHDVLTRSKSSVVILLRYRRGSHLEQVCHMVSIVSRNDRRRHHHSGVSMGARTCCCEYFQTRKLPAPCLSSSLSSALFGIIVLTVYLRKSTTGSQRGVSLNMILAANTTLLRLVESWTTLDISLGAIAHLRLMEQKTPREDQLWEHHSPRKGWPSKGTIKIKNITVSYE